MESKEKETMLRCAECGTNFPLAEHEKEWYTAKGFDLPRRCPFCRRLRRIDNRQGVRP